jgi:hypothetical protein
MIFHVTLENAEDGWIATQNVLLFRVVSHKGKMKKLFNCG